MKNYARLITKKVVGYQKVNINGKLEKQHNSFEKMEYVFSNIHTLRAWSSTLFETFEKMKVPITLNHGTTSVTKKDIQNHENSLEKIYKENSKRQRTE